jgi:hypothetical protein
VPGSPGGSHERGGWRRLAVQAAGVLLAAGCAVLLVAKAEDGVRGTDELSSTASVNGAAAQNAYYDCLSSQAQRLVPSGGTVAISTTSQSADNSTLFSAIVGWADIASDAQHATVVLGLVSRSGPGSCAGSVVVATSGVTR